MAETAFEIETNINTTFLTPKTTIDLNEANSTFINTYNEYLGILPQEGNWQYSGNCRDEVFNWNNNHEELLGTEVSSMGLQFIQEPLARQEGGPIHWISTNSQVQPPCSVALQDPV